MREATHEFEDHTADVRLRAQGPTLAALFEQAGLGLAEVLAPEARGGEGELEEIRLEARDHEGLLVDWLNELIYRTETTGKVFADLHVDRADGGGLVARVRGAPPPELKTQVKAATFHDLHVIEDEEGFTAAVVLDV